MFKKRKKKLKTEEIIKEYSMKETYEANNLYIANLYYISSRYEVPSQGGPKIYTTEQKYFFEKILTTEGIQYQEIFTGFITEDSSKCSIFDQPYLKNIEPFTNYFPWEKNKNVHKYSMILRLNEINKKTKPNKKIRSK